MTFQLPTNLSATISQSRARISIFNHEIDLDIVATTLTVLSILAVSRVVKLVRGLQSVNYMPGLRIPFQPLGFPGAVLPTSWWNPGMHFPWLWKNHFYKKYQSENVSVIPFVFGVPGIYTSNIDVARQVVAGGHKTSFIKPETASRALLLWGMNLIAADKEMWRKHRRIMGPAFTQQLYQMVWEQTIETYREMISVEGWADKQSVEVMSVQSLTFKLAFLIIGKCGFGFSFNWAEPPSSPDGSMSIQEALRVVADDHMLAIFLPNWIKRLPFRRLRILKTAHEQLMGFMQEQVSQKRAEIRGRDSVDKGKSDVFTMLVKANEDEAGKFRLDDEELIGNVFIMLFAGHETTAHSLAATLGFLSLHQDIQQEVLEQIIEVVGWNRVPVLGDYSKLNKVLAVFYEALRMFPAGHVMIREASEDTVLNIPNPPGEEGSTSMPIPKGVQVVVDMIGVQYNPRYFDEPNDYKPSRWYGVSNESEAFSAFSVGPRACIGRKFATTESVCFLTLLLRDWRVEPVLEKGETLDAWKQRVLDAKVILTLGVADVPIHFVRRK
ncbi:cytochrome P450 [Cyathus striatus]|nr:cytochrome P450 [Cyathus striatus]